MDYEKLYKEALERARDYWETNNNNTLNITAKGTMEYLFPELAESEDEKVRKEIIAFIKKRDRSGCDYDYDKWLAWLEKQDIKTNPYSGISFEYNGHIWGMCARDNGVDILCDKYFIEHLEKQEQKPTDKVEPKFKVGDWVVQESIGVYKVIEVCESWYEVIDIENNHYSISFDKEYMCHLWTIEDAKDGDVLYHKAESGIEYIVMGKHLNEHNNIDSYFRYNSINGFGIDIPSVLSAKYDSITPATKEQRDLLFQKMKEAGYEWNADKKGLKKIDARENLTLDGDLMEADCMIVEKKYDWSKEDEQYLLVCKNALAKYQTTDKWDAGIISHWLENRLKSLKRIGG